MVTRTQTTGRGWSSLPPPSPSSSVPLCARGQSGGDTSVAQIRDRGVSLPQEGGEHGPSPGSCPAALLGSGPRRWRWPLPGKAPERDWGPAVALLLHPGALSSPSTHVTLSTLTEASSGSGAGTQRPQDTGPDSAEPRVSWQGQTQIVK